VKTVIPLWDDPQLEQTFSPKDYQLRKELRNFPSRALGREIRQIKGSQLILWAYDLKVLRNAELWEGVALCSPAKEKWVWDKEGRKQKITFPGWLGEDFLRLVLSALLIPFWLLYFKITLPLLEQALKGKKPQMGKTQTLGFLRTDHWFGIKAGGSVGHLSGVIKGFSENQYIPVVFSSDHLPGVPEDKFPFHLMRPDGGFASFREIPELIYNLKLDRRIGEILKTNPPDFIYQRYSLNNFSGLLLALQLKIPLVLEYNGSFTWMEKHWGEGLCYPGLCGKIEDLNLRYADLIVVVSQAMKDDLISRGFSPQLILVNPNGVDMDLFAPQRGANALELRRKLGLEDKVVAGFIGTFGPWHGIEELARAVKPAVSRNPNLHFLLIGTGLLQKRVKEILKQDGVEEFVTLTGLVPQEMAPDYLAACDILLSPHVPNLDGSRFFGSPTKLFEYMATGKAIIASNLEQIGEILEAGKTALLVEPGNIEQLAEKIVYLAQNPQIREQLGAAARETAREKYTWRENAEKVISALKEKFNQ